MPFTLSHAAAALPFRHTRLIPSALVFGTFAPDIEYFIRLSPGGGWGHTLGGAFGLSLPLGLTALWLFHRFLKVPAVHLLPEGPQRRLSPYMGRFRFGGPGRFMLIVFSLLVGIATHICWDSFTHERTWLYFHSPFLQQRIPLYGIHSISVVEVLQLLSTAVGFVAIYVWVARWYAAAPLPAEPAKLLLSPAQRWSLLAIMCAVGAMAAIVRAYFGIGIPDDHESTVLFGGQAIVTGMAVVGWQVLIWGLFLRFRAFRNLFASEQPYTRARS